MRLIAKNHGITIDIDKLPLDDTKSFTLISQGKTSGVFQLESDGLKEVLRKLQPDKFEDIIAVNALYRPGPLGSGMVDDYIERRHGRQKISYLFPELEPIFTRNIWRHRLSRASNENCIGNWRLFLGRSRYFATRHGKEKS